MTKALGFYIFVAVLSLFVMGCGNQVSDYINGTKRTVPHSVGSNETDNMYMKITPGKLLSTMTNGTAEGAIEGTITPTIQTYTLAPTIPGTSMVMTATMSRSRTKPQ
jgi:hypothetical protein